MKVLAIRTEKGNFLANYNGYYFYVGSDRKTLLRMSNEEEFQNAIEKWGNNTEPRHISEVKKIIELCALSQKTRKHIDRIDLVDLELFDTENFCEEFSYVNNTFNYVFGFYANGEFRKFDSKTGGNGTSDYGNHGTPISWEGETYLDTLKRIIDETGIYPELLLITESNHQDRQGDGYKAETIAAVLPAKEAIDAYFKSAMIAYETMKSMPLIIS